ncbi:hypothetical protein D3C86_1340470 [compost metagenome]
MGGQPGLAQQRGDFGGQFGVAGGGVLHGKQFGREAAEVVPGFRVWMAGHQQLVAFPVGRDNHDGFRPGQFGGEPSQRRPTGARLQGEHGRAMGNEQAGEHGWGPWR